MNSKILNASDVLAGDVLLCYSAQTVDKGNYGGTGYCHVAINIGSLGVLESSSKVQMTSIEKLLEVYDYIAVLRDQNNWNPSNLIKLEKFASDSCGKSFNSLGLKKFDKRKEQHAKNLMKNISEYFAGNALQPNQNQNSFFCSQLVTAAFIEVGLIHKSASIVLSPLTTSPEEIGKDKVFGFFYGYLKSHNGSVIPENDYFRYSV